MIFASSRGANAARKSLILVSALSTLSVSVAHAQALDENVLTPVIVSASRFESDPGAAPIGATVITAQQIREAGVGDVNEAIRKIGGVYGRQNLNGTSDFGLDLRGFGTNSDHNVVVLVDGIRLSENEQAAALTSSIPIESVERIEIVRGGSSVLYGDGATGGTVQIITKRGQANTTSGSLVAEVGNRDYRDARASLSKGWENFSIYANLENLRTDNYRDNNELKQENFSGGLQWASKEARFGLRVDAVRQEFRLPGALSWDEFKKNPRQTNTPLDFGSLDSDRYTLFGERNIGALHLAAELSRRDKKVKSHLDMFGDSSAASHATQFSPRLRYSSGGDGTRNEFVAGVDFLDSRREVSRAFSDSDAKQESIGIYARNEIHFEKLRLAVGARHERFEQDFTDPLSFSFPEYEESFSLNAWDLQASYQFSRPVNFFVKLGHSYRVANVDEYTFSPNNEVLDPQRSRDFELGATYAENENRLTLRLFQHRLSNEIYYDPTVPNVGFPGANTNLDDTRRQGFEVAASSRIASAVTLSAAWQHVSAKFTDGPNRGREMALVPKNTATLRLNWLPGNGHSADVGVQWVDTQRYGDDFSNACNVRIPSFATLDARYAIRRGAWEFAVAGSNLTDKDYFTRAFGDCRDTAALYPDAGRALKFTARMDF